MRAKACIDLVQDQSMRQCDADQGTHQNHTSQHDQRLQNRKGRVSTLRIANGDLKTHTTAPRQPSARLQ
jgi:hypothetical protein